MRWNARVRRHLHVTKPSMIYRRYEMMIVTSPNDEVLMTPGHVTDDLFLGAAVHSKVPCAGIVCVCVCV